MLLTKDVLRERMAWFLAPPANTGSLRMESRKTESTVKEGPRKACRLDSSGSSTLGAWLVHGMLADLGSGVRGLCWGGAWGCALGKAGYSLGTGWARGLLLLEGDGSTEMGCRLSLDSRSWMLVLRVLPSAVEITLLARGKPVEEEAEASSRSDTDVAFP